MSQKGLIRKCEPVPVSWAMNKPGEVNELWLLLSNKRNWGNGYDDRNNCGKALCFSLSKRSATPSGQDYHTRATQMVCLFLSKNSILKKKFLKIVAVLWCWSGICVTLV